MVATSVVHVFDYLLGFAVFGLIYWILNGILPEFGLISVQDDVYTYAWYIWHGAIVIYLVIGPFWFLNALKEWQVEQRYLR